MRVWAYRVEVEVEAVWERCVCGSIEGMVFMNHPSPFPAVCFPVDLEPITCPCRTVFPIYKMGILTFCSHSVTEEDDSLLASVLFLFEIYKGEACIQEVRVGVSGMRLPALSKGIMLYDRMRFLTCL